MKKRGSKWNSAIETVRGNTTIMSIMSGKALAKPQILNKHDGLKHSGSNQGTTNIICAIIFD